MTIETDWLTKNEYSRPARPLREVLAVVIHWTANAAAGAKENRDYFEARKDGSNGYGSAHYIIGQSGVILAIIPEDEIAYHCGSRVYTDEARRRFGLYASEHSSPNNCTIGVELCPINNAGEFSEVTIEAAVELCADICSRYKLQPDAITTHHDIVGWKDCPRLWTRHPELLDAFRASVADKLKRG